jgi:hypothetical protein
MRVSFAVVAARSRPPATYDGICASNTSTAKNGVGVTSAESSRSPRATPEELRSSGGTVSPRQPCFVEGYGIHGGDEAPVEGGW